MLANARQIIAQAQGPFGSWLRAQYAANPQRTMALLAAIVPAAALRENLNDFFEETESEA
jgi:hypothetical protein